MQKGNAPVERKLQRLFRRGDACRLIKRCNDFGAGGVSVAVGELADGLYVDLNKVSKKYEGLDGTELAISESQERMAVDVAAEDVDEFLGYAKEENLEAEVIATVTEDPRMTMVWNGDTIVDLSRDSSPPTALRSIRWCMSRRSTATPPRGRPARLPSACTPCSPI